jgi:antitoxin component YwqK of YwqJK toxin-antitoxin module
MILDYDDADFDEAGMRTYQGEFYTGVIVERLEDGTVVTETSYKHGVQDGPTRAFYHSGTLHGEGSFRSGIPVGVHRTWNEDGSLQSELEYDDLGQVIRRST